MTGQNRRFDDTFWGQLLRFWPFILGVVTLVLAYEGVVWSRLFDHETRLSVVEKSDSDVRSDVSEIKRDIKTLLSRK